VLLDARDSVTPVEFEDFAGNSGTVYVSAIQFRPMWVDPELPSGAHGPSFIADMSLIQFTTPCIDTTIAVDTTVYGDYIVPCTLTITATKTLSILAVP
jgi:hypothetical protein